MKIRITAQKKQGSVLLVSLLTAVIIGLALGSYLTLTANQNQSVYRSMTWNEAIPVAESGVEEALAQIYYHGITNFSVNNWTWGTDGNYHKTRSVGGEGSYYDVAVKPVDPPLITATAYVRTPLKSTSAFGMILGAATSGGNSITYTKRRVQVNTLKQSGLTGAIIAKGAIDFSGQNVQVDGFNSTDPRYSTNGMYDPTPAKTKPIGDVRSNVGASKTAAIGVGNSDIKGHVTTGPLGVVEVGSGGSVGDIAWVNAGTQGIQPGFRTDDSNFALIDVTEPFSGNYFTPVGGKVDKTQYNYIFDQAGNYKLSVLTGKVLVKANVTVWVTDDVNIGTGDFIQIEPGASLKLYVSAPSASIGGQGVVNPNGSATSFSYFGLPTNTAFDFKANASFTGTVYAPQASVQLGGGGSDTYDFVGSLVVNTMKMNGHMRVHYDEALRSLIAGPYIASSWNEVDPNTPLR